MQAALPTPYETLAAAITAQVDGPTDLATTIDGLSLFRRDAPTPPAMCRAEPSLVLVARGEKRMWLGGEAFSYVPSRFLLTSLELPANSEVLLASDQQPCVGLVLRLDVRILADLIAHGGLPVPRERPISKGVGTGTMTAPLLASLTRLVEVLGDPVALPVLAPLILREIHFHLLRTDQGARVRQIAAVDSHGYRIARAVNWLKHHYKTPLRIEELAASVQMSPPTFHHHFRQLTAMSPLQYQKWLRLNEAKRLMLNERLDVKRAGYAVGYESPSQFSREYSRLFGTAPSRDLAALRNPTA